MTYHSIPGYFHDGYSGVYTGHEAALDGYVSPNNVFTLPVSTRNVFQGSVTVKCPATGSPVGTLQLQYSNNQGRNKNGTLSPLDDFNNWDWYDAPEPPDCSISVSGATTALMNFGGYANTLGALWVRLKYTRVSGTITITANYVLKG